MNYIGTTSILHNTEFKTDVKSCDDPGCYTKQIKYNATLRQMAMLADISGSCQQYFRVKLKIIAFAWLIVFVHCAGVYLLKQQIS